MPHPGPLDEQMPVCLCMAGKLSPLLKMEAERAKDTGELTKIVDTDAPPEKLDTPTGFLCSWDLGKLF